MSSHCIRLIGMIKLTATAKNNNTILIGFFCDGRAEKSPIIKSIELKYSHT